MAIGALIMESGELVAGRLFGGPAPSIPDLADATDRLLGAGEVVFNTAMTGYHEILTDPSYAGQIVTLTYPHAGNYGCEATWDESGGITGTLRRRIKAQGLIVRRLYSGEPPAGRQGLDAFLAESEVPGLTEADTRRVTLRIRSGGAANGVILALPERYADMPMHRLAGLRSVEQLLSAEEQDAVREYFRSLPSMEGRDLVSWVVSATPYTEGDANPRDGDAGRPKLCLVDYGAKGNISRLLESFGAHVQTVPGTASADEVQATGADGVVLSNGPGDPAVLQTQVETVASLIGHRPMLGICLGHQLIAEALQARTYKLSFGHHGANHPVVDTETGRVFVTSQNHGFAVDPKSLPPSVKLWLRNSNDGTVEGLKSEDRELWSAQFHPEAAPGPWDCRFILADYVNAVRESAGGSVGGLGYAGSK